MPSIRHESAYYEMDWEWIDDEIEFDHWDQDDYWDGGFPADEYKVLHNPAPIVELGLPEEKNEFSHDNAGVILSIAFHEKE